MRLKAIIVDDEELARRGLRQRLEQRDDFEVVAECRNGREAVEAIRRHAPDLLFLDVQMPGKNGFDVIEAVGAESCPYVIFVTAHDRYAIRAFRVNALDYLLKPIDDEVFDAAMRRAHQAITRRHDGAFGRKLAAMLGDLKAEAPADRLVIRSSGRMVFVRIPEIDWVEAAGDYVTLHCGKKTWLMRETIVRIEKKLGEQFARVHRSTIVNTSRVVEMKALDNGEYILVLQDGTPVKLSRNYRGALQKLVGSGV